MRFAKPTLVGTIALLWMLLSTHCVFETLAGVELLSCGSHVEHASDESSGCDEHCCPVEFAAYKTQRQDALVPPYTVLAEAFDLTLRSEQGIPCELCLGVQTSAPPELLHRWQFQSRRALPIRAPAVSS